MTDPDFSRVRQHQKPLPLYAQIKTTLREQILDGSYGEHARLPSENELMTEFGVSRITVRQALSDLQSEQLIFKVPGKGAFVARPQPFQQQARLQGFAEAMSNLGVATHNRLVSLRKVAADATVAERLQVAEGSPLIEIRRVRHAGGKIVSLDVTYVRRALGERLAREDLASRDIFLIIENDYATPLGHADLTINAIAADAPLATLLDVPVGAPLLRMERLTWTRDGQPIDFEYLYYRGDSFRYQVRAERG
ncbi:GntR family transcriptional regulator [Azonexus sp. R2A61]|uniref:GntR family transcriptional regulator n=1 Tax=Azonexus sp. R2A61 TaxID=2744443 RepID=UPI001F3538AC|nr:GntR family transcriptional regulator [Azonexus sp. R2A61]